MGIGTHEQVVPKGTGPIIERAHQLRVELAVDVRQRDPDHTAALREQPLREQVRPVLQILNRLTDTLSSRLRYLIWGIEDPTDRCDRNPGALSDAPDRNRTRATILTCFLPFHVG